MGNLLELVSIERGKIITNFQYIEGLLKDYISKHYFKNTKEQILFKRELLEDEYFSFFLLKKVFEKIFKKYDVNKYTKNKAIFDKLNQLAKLRNLVAHAGIEGSARLASSSSITLTKLFFRHGGEEKSIQKTIGEYNKLSGELQPILENII